MANKQTSNKITIANIVAMVGIVLLGIFTFMGHSYLSGGELAWDVIVSLAVVSVTSLLLWLLIRAKGAENELDKWKKTEYTTLGIYIIFAITTSIYCGTMHFFIVNAQKDDIKQFAFNDLTKIDTLFVQYRDFETEAINQTKTGLLNSYSAGAQRSSILKDFLRRYEIPHRNAVNTFCEDEQHKLLGDRYDDLFANYESQKRDIKNVINNWNTLKIASKAKAIEDLAEILSQKLTEWSAQAILPKVNQENGKYTIVQNTQQKEYKINVESLEFKKAIAETTGFSFLALLMILLIHALILFNYIVAYRTHTVKTKSNRNDDGGIILE